VRTLEERIIHIERDLLPGLLDYEEIGWTAETEELLEMIEPAIIEAKREDLLDKVRKIEEWLGNAKTEEAVRGKDCLFNVDHPLVQQSIARLTASGRTMRLYPGSPRPFFVKAKVA